MVAVFDLVDYVSATGETAGRAAAQFAAGRLMSAGALSVSAGSNVAFIIPQKVSLADPNTPVTFYLRVKESKEGAETVVKAGETLIKKIPQIVVRPPEMVSFTLTPAEITFTRENLMVSVV